MEDAPHRVDLREAHGANVVVIVRLPRVVVEVVGVESASDAVVSLDDFEWDTEVEQDERGV